MSSFMENMEAEMIQGLLKGDKSVLQRHFSAWVWEAVQTDREKSLALAQRWYALQRQSSTLQSLHIGFLAAWIDLADNARNAAPHQRVDWEASGKTEYEQDVYGCIHESW